jgi:hypothetical protein
MSDRGAIESFTPAVQAAAFECGNSTAPWTFVAEALECETTTEVAILES